MYKNKIIFLLVFTFLITSCGGTVDSIKRGLTGAKSQSTDEFLIKKKEPLTLPPNFETLPLPSAREEAVNEITSFEKTLKDLSLTENTSSSGSSAEQSILRQIRKK